MAEALRRLVARLLRRRERPDQAIDLSAHDRRLDAIEQDQREIDARLRVLDFEANIRRRGHRG